MNRPAFWEDAKTVAIAAFLCWSLYNLHPLIGRSLAFTVATTPLAGALLRFRINLVPKMGSIALPEDGDEEGQAVLEEEDIPQEEEEEEMAHVTGYLHMLRTTYYVETWRGLYKGVGPALTAHLLSLLLSATVNFSRCKNFPMLYWLNCMWQLGDFESWVDSIMIWLIPRFMRFPPCKEVIVILVRAPFDVGVFFFTARAMTTRYDLPFFAHPRTALRAFLSHTERTRPFTLLRTLLKLMLTTLLRSSLIILLWRPLMHLLQRNWRLPNEPEWMTPLKDAAFCAGILIAALVLTPLDVVIARMNVLYPAQEIVEGDGDQIVSGTDTNPLDSDDNVTSTEHQTAAGRVTECNLVPRAYRLRDEPYRGYFACLRDVWTEEGYSALLRGWYATAIVLYAAL